MDITDSAGFDMPAGYALARVDVRVDGRPGFMVMLYEVESRNVVFRCNAAIIGKPGEDGRPPILTSYSRSPYPQHEQIRKGMHFKLQTGYILPRYDMVLTGRNCNVLGGDPFLFGMQINALVGSEVHFAIWKAHAGDLVHVSKDRLLAWYKTFWEPNSFCSLVAFASSAPIDPWLHWRVDFEAVANLNPDPLPRGISEPFTLDRMLESL
ncbi:hypothetical protein HNP46_006109 [Pseudomonas nitritireducens]|uniref:Uncharacterized protein n=1 Tax=Pseudomonas nitroreducens TaxID=46680 RepID=A0A7W7KRX7_PSENT|nr:hypothetical protein [Pseudomonas nitritireducens]MBB4867198.1 hypothetical protein [Pseudomonas nitritireducens]